MSRMAYPLLLAGCLAACESEINAPTDLKAGEIQLNASATNQYTYFSFTSGQAISVASPTTSSDWDVAFRRYEVRLNGGVVGPKGVAGYNLANNASATPAQVLAFTPDNQKPSFDAVIASDIPSGSSLLQESLIANPLGWLAFGPQGPVANGGAAWKLRRQAGGGFAVFRATGATLAGTGQTASLATVTIVWRYQSAGGALGAPQQATINLGTSNTTVNFATGSLGPAVGCDWDLRAQPDFALVTNAGCQVGTFPLSASETFDGLTTAGDALQYGGFLSGLSGAVPFTSALDDPRGPFLYNLAGDNRLTPTFNIYLIRVGTSLYKIQLTGYYSTAGASGYPTLRYAQLQ